MKIETKTLRILQDHERIQATDLYRRVDHRGEPGPWLPCPYTASTLESIPLTVHDARRRHERLDIEGARDWARPVDTESGAATIEENLAPRAVKPDQYSPTIDAIIYGEHTRDFTQRDWAELAMACLDQAGARRVVYSIGEKVVYSIGKKGGDDV